MLYASEFCFSACAFQKLDTEQKSAKADKLKDEQNKQSEKTGKSKIRLFRPLFTKRVIIPL